jgi:ribosome biogenesis GTPase A
LGYPNVGKSSTINRFLNCKRLQVSFNWYGRN